MVRPISLMLKPQTGPIVLAQAAPVGLHAEAVTDIKSMVWHDWQRYCASQRRDMTKGGAEGLRALSQLDQPAWVNLWLSPRLHARISASFGMGACRLATED